MQKIVQGPQIILQNWLFMVCANSKLLRNATLGWHGLGFVKFSSNINFQGLNYSSTQSYSMSFYLPSSVPPAISKFSFGEDPLNSGDMASLQCMITKGDTPVKISWEFHGADATRRTQTGVKTMNMGDKISWLTIESVTSEHSGFYTVSKNVMHPNFHCVWN